MRVVIFFVSFFKLLNAYSYQNNKVETLTYNQERYIEYMKDDFSLVIGTGPAGTGKTWLACKAAINELNDNKVKKLVITRPIATVDKEDIGFLPGNLEEKFQPFSQPLFDNIEKETTKLDSFIRSRKIEICPLGYMRGRTFDNCFIIADEMQNSSPGQMKMLLTRLGENSKIIINGDNSQCDLDLISTKRNGLDYLLEKINFYYKNDSTSMNNDKISIIEFDENDSRRSKFVRKILKVL